MKALPLNSIGGPRLKCPTSKYLPTESETKIALYDDGTYLCFDHGGFDNYCVFIRSKDGLNLCPHDQDYFRFARELGDLCSNRGEIFWAFMNAYAHIQDFQPEANPQDIEELEKRAKEFGHIQKEVFLFLTIMYATMIAEENWRGGKTLLGRDVKKVGIFKVLVEDCDPKVASDSLREADWNSILAESLRQNIILRNLTDKGKEMDKWRRQPTPLSRS